MRYWTTNSMVRMQALCALLLGCVLAEAQSDEWMQLSQHVGKDITVQSIDGQKVAGELFRVEASRIGVLENGVSRLISRENVKQVQEKKRRRTAIWTVAMSGAGFAAGTLIGFRAFDDATFAGRKILTTSLVGAGAGGAAGYAISRAGKKERVLYRADQEARR